ncbi:SNF2-related protein [Penicillium vulpinum]|uniref:Uncharacterized protein n=1 Tax=Penicillium vulpinum TaxID=29845 RepID=A0A1V6SET6_9EURO|nr:SNF2-related protein [Penicillium vulpinum]KAJ5958322.1 SNF2-related protein [Penicillium vulpinum]OQE12438.1 hypothetical protein PENVUL_c001G00133 [Penicillium vulpinum]
MAPPATMSSTKDPWDWSIDELVAFLCHDKPGDWSYNLACPDLVALEGSLRENSISGLSFLAITDAYVKELGVKPIGQRQYVLKASQWLQRRSPKFQLDQQPFPSKALLGEHQLSPEHLNHPINNNLIPEDPITVTTAKDTINNTPLLHGPSSTQTGGKGPRRMETTVIERPPASSLLQTRSPEPPISNSGFGRDDFFDYLTTAYPLDDADVLPVYGESSDEGEYDTDTREEMEEDEVEPRPDTSGDLGMAEYNAIIDEYIKEKDKHCVENRLPKEQPKAFQIWRSGQNLPSMENKALARLTHLEKRCQALRKALVEAQHSSRSSLHQACACLDPTIVDICLARWKFSILKQTTAPPKVDRPPRTPRVSKPNVNSDGEETLSSDSDSVHNTGDEIQDESPEQSEDDLDFEGVEILQHQEEPRSHATYRGPFCESSDEDVSHLLDEEEKKLPAAKRRRLQNNSAHQDNRTSPLMPMTTPLFGRDVVLSLDECETEGQMETMARLVNPMHLNTHDEPVVSASDSSDTDEAVCIFDDVYSLTWAAIEESGNRFHLVAKALIVLQNDRINQLCKFLGFYMSSSYREFAREALKHMSEDSTVIKGWDPEESFAAMLMTTLFVSWVNVMQIPHDAFAVKDVKAALASVGDDLDEDQFAPFFKCLGNLLRGYRKWLTSSSRVQPHEKKLTQHQSSRRKMAAVSVTLNRAQKDGQQRQANQDEAKRALRSRVDYEEIPAKPVSFRDPVIQLDPYIGSLIQPHQLHGVQFMFREIVENIQPEGCLLAHTMGLGKTMQVISLLVTISTAGASQDPAIRAQIPEELRRLKALIICPASLVQNWCTEFAIWSPDNHNMGKVRPITAKSSTSSSDRTQEIRAWNNEGGILIVSYENFRNLAGNNGSHDEDPEKQLIDEFVKSCLLESPNLVVADEAQVLRNNTTKIAQTACRIRTRKRIALSGTPLSNGLKDYYWMIDWVAPRYLGTFADFNEQFITPIENGSHIESTWLDRRDALQRQELFFRIIDPKVQRADMSVLADKLPPKYEFSVYFELTSFQKAAYNLVVEGIRLGKTENVSPKLMSCLFPIKLCCHHPVLLKQNLEDRATKGAHNKHKSPSVDDHGLDSSFAAATEEVTLPRSSLSELDDLFSTVPDLLDPSLSSRVTILNEIVKQAIKVGDKVLVFSSSVTTLEYLAQLMDRTQRKYYLLDGTVAAVERPEIIRKFNNDQSIHVFLVSTRAGGIGLNIHAANRVVIFDFMFNPTFEEQAVGRAYRIGQKKSVFVYRLIAGGTYEEKLYAKNVFKSQLAYRIVDKKNLIRQGSNSDSTYLASYTESSQHGGIDDTAVEKDPKVMEGLRSSECAHSILSIKLSSQEIDPQDRLTVIERQSVEDQLHLRRLRIASVPS